MEEFQVTLVVRLSASDIAYIDRTARHGNLSIVDRVSDLLTTAIQGELLEEDVHEARLTVDHTDSPL
jgi:hypothetical protein